MSQQTAAADISLQAGGSVSSDNWSEQSQNRIPVVGHTGLTWFNRRVTAVQFMKSVKPSVHPLNDNDIYVLFF